MTEFSASQTSSQWLALSVCLWITKLYELLMDVVILVREIKTSKIGYDVHDRECKASRTKLLTKPKGIPLYTAINT